MFLVKKFIWDFWNTQHIALHHITPNEVEEAVHNNPLVLRGYKKGRLIILSKTDGKRLIAIVLEAKSKGTYYPITSYEAGIQDRTLYYRLKGGDQNEK